MKLFDYCSEDPWIFVSILLTVHYTILFTVASNTTPVDLDFGGISYNYVLATYQIYFILAVFNGLIILAYQCRIKDFNFVMKTVLYAMVVFHVVCELYFFIILSPTIYMFSPLNNMEANGTWIDDFDEMKHLVDGLRFRQVKSVDKFTLHGGIAGPPSYLEALIDLKKNVDKIQSDFYCCGLRHPSDWITVLSGDLTNEERKLGSMYIWWTEEPNVSYYPDSCCTKNRGSTCLPFDRGCMEAVSGSAWTNILFLVVLAIILGVISICRDVVLIKTMHNMDLEPLPIIEKSRESD
ncbi:hypothetical protein FO519_001313 [Halicephalobus sp. NKZ332]|nr:hypothetical protein FO519_001313 [Halicephalobus sp. NKZ332]